MLVDAGQQVLHFQGSTGAYLEPPAGTASFDVLKMAREGLMLPLRAALNQARKENKAVRREDVHFRRNGGAHAVNLEVIPLKNLAERCFLILFEEPGGDGRAASPESAAAGDGKAPLTEEEESGRIAELETELSETRDYLQSLQEQHESANEELQAAYEEVESANEELQSINEELETSKEELESANEELTTVNEEMSNRNVELDRLNNDLVNLQTSAKLAVVVLGRDLAIRRFSAQAEKQLDLQATDVGRPINHVRHGLALEENPESPIDLETLAAEVISSVREQEYEVRDQAGRWFSLRVRPYITLDNKVDGAVLVLVDIDALKRSEQAIAATRDYAQNVVDTVREPLLVLDGTLRVESANRSFYKTFHATPAETAGRFIYDLGKRQWDIPRLRELLEGILPQSTSIEDFEVTHDFEQLGPRTMLLNARRIHDPQRNAERILLAIEDVTDATESRRELEASEEKYRALFTSIDEGFCIIEKVDGEADAPLDFRYVEANPAFAAQSGVGDVVGKTIRQAFPGEPEEWFETYDAVLRTGESIRFERGLVTQGRVLELFAFRVEGETRRRVAVIFKDITESKRSEQNLARSEQRYRRLFETAKDGILILDADTMRITDANPFMSELLSYSQGEFTGKELWEVGLFRDKSESQRAMRELQESGYVRYEDLPLEGEHGNVQEVELIGNVYRQDDHVVAQCNIRDITERKRMERQIQGQARELADASRRKDEFLAMLSHELRNPMAPIFNALQLIGRQDGENELQREARGVIERQVRHMSRLVDDLLEVSRITTGRIQLHTERVDVNGVVERAVERVRPVIDRRGQQLSLSLAEGVIWLDADSTRLEQVFGNLLNNASKYNEEGGHIELIVERQDDHALIRIRDDGIGMAPDVLPRVFDLFTQADKSLDRAEGGLGIGLALVKNLVEMHRGTVEAHSDGLGGGSEFVVRLPAASEGTTPREPAPAQPTAMADASRILVVDDNVDAAKMSAMLLRSWGYDVRTAHDGPNALQRAAGFHPNVILLDIGLPGMDGYEVARLIRRDADLNDVRLVAVTGYGQDTDRQRSKEAGFDLHVVKPVEPSALKELLAELHFPTA
ncbi:MAG TPA: PAS domain S-box protein [Rhodothermales bacterium]|nr:PAS domain S-box protein [Rhodothermales bacterium]